VVQQEREWIEYIGDVVLKCFFKFGRINVLLYGLGGLLFFCVYIVNTHEGRRVSYIPDCLIILVNQHLEDTDIPANLGICAVGNKIDDGRGFFLSVSVDPAIALLEDHK